MYFRILYPKKPPLDKWDRQIKNKVKRQESIWKVLRCSKSVLISSIISTIYEAFSEDMQNSSNKCSNLWRDFKNWEMERVQQAHPDIFNLQKRT